MNQQETPQLTPLQKAAAGRKLIEAEIICRAWADETFREKLENDPASALAEAGIPFPKDKDLRVIHEESNTVTLVLPPSPAHEEAATDEELEAVAGGSLIKGGDCGGLKKVQSDLKSKQISTAGAIVSIIGYGAFAAVSGYSYLWD